MRLAALAFTVLASASIFGCAASPAERAARDASTMSAARDPEKLTARGIAFAQIGDLTRAEQYLAAAVDAGAPADKVLPKLLVVCIASTHYRAGIEYAAPELQRNPDNASLRFVVAELESLVGDTAAARQDLDVVTRTLPNEPVPHFAYARFLRDKAGDRVSADREFRAYLRLAPRGEHVNEARTSLLKAVAVAEAPRAKEITRQ